MEISFDSVPVPVVLETCSKGSESLQGLLEIMEGRLALDKTSYMFSQTVSTKNLHDFEIKKSSSERTMGFLKNYYLFSAMEQLKYQRAMKENVVNKLSEVKSQRNAVLQKNKTLIETCSRDVKQAGEMLSKAKAAFVKAKAECHFQRERLAHLEMVVETAVAERLASEAKRAASDTAESAKRGKSFSKMFSAAFETLPETERDKQASRVGRRVSDLIASSADIKTRKAMLLEKISVRDFTVQQAVLALQEAEAERLSSTKQTMLEFCALERSSLNEQSRLLKMLEDTVADHDSEKDIRAFIATEKRTESTLKYTKALALLDWDYMRRDIPSPSDQESVFLEESSKSRLFEGDVSLSAAAAAPEDELLSAVWTDTADDTSRETFSSPTLPDANAELGALMKSGDEEDEDDMVDDASPLQKLRTLGSIGSNGQVDALAAEDPESHRSPQYTRAISPLPPSPISPTGSISMSLSPCPASLESQQTLAALRAVFGPSVKATSSPSSSPDNENLIEYSESQWGLMMESSAGREVLLQALDERRSDGCLSREGFDMAAMALTAILNAGLQSDDVKSAMRVIAMANTFYCIDGSLSDDSDDSLGAVTIPGQEGGAETESVTPPQNSSRSQDSDRRRYLQREPSIKRHKQWSKEGFWESALIDGVGKQMALQPSVKWDDLPQEALREAVQGVHNIIFGQLGALALTMRELGLKSSEIERTIRDMCRGSQLSEEQEGLLMRNVSQSAPHT